MSQLDFTTPVKLKLELAQATQPAWLDQVLEKFDSFLCDHASCEKKASGMALSIAAHYSDKPLILSTMVDLAVEELSHFREVIKLLLKRNVQLAPDRKDPYIHQLHRLIRKGPEFYLMDRLLIAAIVERRGHERFGMIAQALPTGAEKTFFHALTTSEKRHYRIFLELAAEYCDVADTQQRLGELCERESELMRALPLRSALH